MQFIVTQSIEEFNRKAAMQVSKQVIVKPDSTIGLATGNTTKGIHEQVVRQHSELPVDYSLAKTCNLDEYIGAAPDNPASCSYRIQNELLSHINICPENTYIPNGMSSPPELELDVFKNKIKSFGGIDLQVIAIGENGHIAFNEPGTPFESSFHIVPIPQSTAAARAVLFGGEEKVPKFGITVGIRDIMMSKKILLVASGKTKAEMVKNVVNGPVTEDVPASVLRLHPNVIFIVDSEAAAKM
ncbi:MAG: glucosamine-6-phosphate deaminase [Oscillospiraceae bacterium]|nr:glucosamine-6-phosphate deaminase [Oscillospiraceae bacterium]